MPIKKNDIVHSTRWPEPVKVDLIEEVGDYVRIVGATTQTHQHIDQLIRRDELEEFLDAKVTTNFSAKPLDVFLSLETKRYRYASLYDPLLAMNTSKVDPLPHQIEAVYGHVLKLPRIRFLIADDPGAGKTIMAGLIIKELKLRQLVHRILIVAPGHLKDQWRRELKEKFEETFVPVDRGLLDAFYGENIWERESQIITSLDFAKREDVLPSISSSRFDLIIVDEAHKMSAYKYGEKLDRTERYRLGEALSRITEHLLFLTATPHKGDPENFRLFLDLLEPGFFASNEMVAQSIASRDNPLFIRRVKEDLKNFEGVPLFLPRNVTTLTFELGIESPDEKDLYNALSKYVNTQYNKALQKDKRRNVAFALVILQRRLASSTYALYMSLQRRRKKLKDLLDGSQEKKLDDRQFDYEVVEDLSEADRWKQEEVWETLSVAENREELLKEIDILDDLIRKAKGIIDGEQEVKLTQLRNTLESLNSKFPGEKMLIFTESKDTLEYLKKKISDWKYLANVIHGGMKLEDRIHAEKVFHNETQVMIATEAAGEGINLQFCHLMINYDIPWNPNRLEQRMGRIHRYGQPKEVFVYNLVASDTREGMVLQKLFKNIEEIKKALGSDKVFDVISELNYGRNLSKLLLEAAANARSIEDILEEIEIVVDEKYIASVKENLGESLATHFIDYTRIKEMADRAREYRLIPEYTEAYFRKVFEKTEGKLRERKDGFVGIDSIPFDLRKIAEEDPFKKRYGSILKSYPKVTFDKDRAFRTSDAEFVCFGHPLFETELEWVERTMFNSLQTGAVFQDPDGKLDGIVLFYEGEIKDGRSAIAGKRLFAFYADQKTGNIRVMNPALIWDLKINGTNGASKSEGIGLVDQIKQRVLSTLIPTLEEYKAELTKERERQATIKEKYGVKSLEQLIVKSDGELIKFYGRKEQGENVDLAIRQKDEQKRKYENALKELMQSIQLSRMLTMSTPTFVGAIMIRPVEKVNPAMQSDEVIEQIGMSLVMAFEKAQQRIPEDVSAQNLGFDIRSVDASGRTLYIEVKARSGKGDIALTQNEWFKAKRFGNDYYLYVVLNAGSQPEIHIISNPAVSLKAEEKIENVRYIVPVSEIISKGEAPKLDWAGGLKEFKDQYTSVELQKKSLEWRD